MESKGRQPHRFKSTNKDQVFDLIQGHPDGLDNDDISELSGVRPSQQVRQLFNRLAAIDCIRRESVSRTGKRRKIHNFPLTPPGEKPRLFPNVDTSWRRRLANLAAATGRDEAELLDESLQANGGQDSGQFDGRSLANMGIRSAFAWRGFKRDRGFRG